MRKKKEIENLEDVINSEDFHKSSNGILTYLWRQYLIENKLDKHGDILIYDFLKRSSENNDYQIKSVNKTALTKKLKENRMSFKTFMFLLTEFIENEEVELTLKVKSKKGIESRHTVDVIDWFKNNGGKDE